MLFGHQNDDTKPTDTPSAQDDTVNPLAVDTATGVSLPASAAAFDESEMNGTPPATESMAPSAPSVDDIALPTRDTSVGDDDMPASSGPAAAPSTPPVADDLLSMKQQALSQLSPLLGQLDQTPEERFRTTMMLIQSTDNQGLLKDAYDAAQAITNEKARAQALLDVVNEINYFTQQKPAA